MKHKPTPKRIDSHGGCTSVTTDFMVLYKSHWHRVWLIDIRLPNSHCIKTNGQWKPLSGLSA